MAAFLDKKTQRGFLVHLYQGISIQVTIIKISALWNFFRCWTLMLLGYRILPRSNVHARSEKVAPILLTFDPRYVRQNNSSDSTKMSWASGKDVFTYCMQCNECMHASGSQTGIGPDNDWEPGRRQGSICLLSLAPFGDKFIWKWRLQMISHTVWVSMC